MSKSKSIIPVVAVILALVACGCVVLGLLFFLMNYRLPAAVAPSAIPIQPLAATQVPQPVQPQGQNQIQAPTQTLEQPLAPIQVQPQALPQYNDFLNKSLTDPVFLDLSGIYCGFGQYNWVCPPLGIEFSASNNMVDRVWIYPSGYANFDQYSGEMPNGLRWGDTNADVVNKIGQPDAYLNYGWIYTNLGISIHYRTDAPATPDPSETINYIMIFLP
jgi:hypothetical protein